MPAQGQELEDWGSCSWSPALLSLLILMVPEEPVSQVCQSAVQSWKGLGPDSRAADLPPHFLLPMAGAGWDRRSGGSLQKLTGSDLEVEQPGVEDVDSQGERQEAEQQDRRPHREEQK